MRSFRLEGSFAETADRSIQVAKGFLGSRTSLSVRVLEDDEDTTGFVRLTGRLAIRLVSRRCQWLSGRHWPSAIRCTVGKPQTPNPLLHLTLPKAPTKSLGDRGGA